MKNSTEMRIPTMSSSVKYTYDAANAKLASIYIIFTKNRTPDDKLRITPSSKSTNFDIEFTQNSIGNRVERTITYSELPYYLESVLNAQNYDSQRCDFVQFDVPGYPSVIMESENVNQYVSRIFYNQVESLHGNWPYEINGKKVEVPSTTVNTVVELDDEEEQEEEQETDEGVEYVSTTQVPVSAPCIRVTRSKAKARTA
jgi:hypothetical protein